jgi:hypothetical protein
MHDCDEVASNAPAIIFHGTSRQPFQETKQSNDGQMKHSGNAHNASASNNEGYGP